MDNSQRAINHHSPYRQAEHHFETPDAGGLFEACNYTEVNNEAHHDIMEVETVNVDGLSEACNSTDSNNQNANGADLLGKAITQFPLNGKSITKVTTTEGNNKCPPSMCHDEKNYATEINNLTPRLILDSNKTILTVGIAEDDRFKLELPSKVVWAELVPNLRKRQIKRVVLPFIHSSSMSHTGTDIVEMVKQQYENHTEFKYEDSVSINVPESQENIGDTSEVESDEDGTNNQALRVHATSKSVSFHYPISITTVIEEHFKASSTEVNEQV
ncbi:unnamed protein product [Ambrosiozyma monospora]|uniref:Unnamed protein product n=1 Tax=Ambrosiozyma monospora TaxID=43982 RepID=A0ACB5T8Z3_AMBMO|nr:unnamed protein product [Ambrosiozyma monospora]